MKVNEFILNRDKYKVDETYQRPSDVWSHKDKQCFIDTIMRGEPIPIIFLNYISEKETYYIVDGQQRLQCIKDFYDNKFCLSKEFSDISLDGKKFKDLSIKERDKFQNYDMKIKIMQDYDDERVRMIFSRLQRGKPLGMGEKLNAKPGKIVNVMRDLAKHDFMSKSIGVNKQRYHVFEDVARIIFYEKYGTKECSTGPLNELFDKYKDDIDINSKIYKKILNVFNYLLKCFPSNPGNYQYLSKHAWVLTVYCVISELRDSYALNGKENEIRKFIESFHSRVYSEDWRTSDIKLQRFYNNTRGGWAEKLNENRKNTMKEYLLKEINLKRLDDNRQITDEEKINAYAKANYSCEKCGKKFKDYKEAEYHHIELYSEGGETSIDNIMVLCKNCHDEIHREKSCYMPINEDDYQEDDE